MRVKLLFALDSEFPASPAGAPGGPPEGRRRRTLLLLLLLFFYFLKVSKVYVFLKFFNFWPLYLLLELRSPRTLPDSPGLPLDTFGSRVWDPKPQTVR